MRSRPGESTTRVDRSRGSAQSRLLTWEPPFRDPKNISAGRSLWHDANLVASGLAKAPTIRSHCSDCHAQDGRGLKYFNFSNASIIARSVFHGLSELQGRQIASYIRSLPFTNPGQGNGFYFSNTADTCLAEQYVRRPHHGRICGDKAADGPGPPDETAQNPPGVDGPAALEIVPKRKSRSAHGASHEPII